MDKHKLANNILEYLVNPRVYPVEKRLYFRPEEILDNRVYEKAIMESNSNYGKQNLNSDFYPKRNQITQREVSAMDRRTLIASFDILAQNFKENDPFAVELRTMAYALANMSDENAQKKLSSEAPDVAEQFEKLAGGNPWMDHMNKVRKENPGESLKELISIAKKTYKKEKTAYEAEDVSAEENVESKKTQYSEEEGSYSDKWSKDATEAVQTALLSDVLGMEAEAGKKKGPGKPDGTGPHGDTSECQMSEEKEAGKKEGPGKPDGTGPYGGTSECQMSNKDQEEKSAATDAAANPGFDSSQEGGKKAEEEDDDSSNEEGKRADEKEADKIVDTEILSSSEVPSTEKWDDIELSNPMASEMDVESMDDSEKQTLDSVFKNADLESLSEDEQSKLEQLFK